MHRLHATVCPYLGPSLTCDCDTPSADLLAILGHDERIILQTLYILLEEDQK